MVLSSEGVVLLHPALNLQGLKGWTFPIPKIWFSPWSINLTDPKLVEDCWLGCHSQPPFYEGIAVVGDFIPINDSHHCRWQPGEWNGLSLSQVSGLGLCVGESHLPTRYSHLCNQTIVPDKYSQYLLPQNDTWWICLDGLTPFDYWGCFHW